MVQSLLEDSRRSRDARGEAGDEGLLHSWGLCGLAAFFPCFWIRRGYGCQQYFKKIRICAKRAGR